MGGIIVGQEVGRTPRQAPHFRREQDGKLVLRRGFKILPGERFIVPKMSLREALKFKDIDIVRNLGGKVASCRLLG